MKLSQLVFLTVMLVSCLPETANHEIYGRWLWTETMFGGGGHIYATPRTAGSYRLWVFDPSGTFVQIERGDTTLNGNFSLGEEVLPFYPNESMLILTINSTTVLSDTTFINSKKYHVLNIDRQLVVYDVSSDADRNTFSRLP